MSTLNSGRIVKTAVFLSWISLFGMSTEYHHVLTGLQT
jgi:hypothetical protein